MKRKKDPFVWSNDMMLLILLATAGLMAVFAVIAQPDETLFQGLLKIQLGEAGLITDPVATGGAGAALLNGALVLLGTTFLVWSMHLPFTGVSIACLYMMAGFSLLGKNLLNILPFLAGGLLYSAYKREPFTKYVYLTLFGTCLSPLVSFLLNRIDGWYRWPIAMLVGVILGFFLPAVAAYTTRIHQGYNLYNVGFAAGFLGVGAASILKGFGMEFTTTGSWSTDSHGILLLFALVLLGGLFLTGVALGCRSRQDYAKILRHSGRAVADFIILDGVPRTLVNMALVGGIGLAYLLYLYHAGVRLNGPLLCCIFSLTGFAAFGKHPKNIVPVMLGAIIAAVIMTGLPITAPGVLLATLLCTSLAPIAGQFGWFWGAVAGFLHMTIVQNTAFLHGGMNLYNNGFSAGLVCVLLVPIIEALRPEPKE